MPLRHDSMALSQCADVTKVVAQEVWTEGEKCKKPLKNGPASAYSPGCAPGRAGTSTKVTGAVIDLG